MRNRLIRLTDVLFGPAPDAERSGRRWLARYLALAGVLAVIVFARRPDSILVPQFWAEDGKVFFYEQLTLGFWSALSNLYAGFPFLAQRIVAALASWFPTVHIPLVYNASAIAITALTMATFSLPGFRHLVQRDSLRAAFCVATVCIPAGQELLATPTTLGYFLVIWLVFLSIVRAPRTRAGVAAWCLGGAAAVFSAPLAPLAFPLWLLRALRGTWQGYGRDLGFAATQVAALFAVIGIARTLGTHGELPGGLPISQWHLGSPWSVLWALGWMTVWGVDLAVLPFAALAQLKTVGSWALLAPAGLVAAGIALTFRELQARGRVVVCLAIYLVVASLCMILIGRPIILHVMAGAVSNVPAFVPLGERHRAVLNIALLLAATGIIDAVGRFRTRLAVAAVTCVVLLLVWTPQFRIPPFPDRNWPLWAAKLDQKLASGSREPLIIPSPAVFFNIVVDAPPPEAPNEPTHDAPGRAGERARRRDR